MIWKKAFTETNKPTTQKVIPHLLAKKEYIFNWNNFLILSFLFFSFLSIIIIIYVFIYLKNIFLVLNYQLLLLFFLLKIKNDNIGEKYSVVIIAKGY